MATKLIKLNDDTLVEIEVPEQEAELVSGFADSVAEKVDSSLGKIKPFLLNAVEPIKEAWQEISQDMYIEQAEVEIGLSFEGEGNLYITKAKAGANLTVKLILKSKEV